MNDAKMKSLDSIIDWADQRLMGKAKRKGEVQPPTAPQAASAPEQLDALPAQDEMDPETARQLMQAYEEEGDTSVAQAVPMA